MKFPFGYNSPIIHFSSFPYSVVMGGLLRDWKGTLGFGKTQCTQAVKTVWVQGIFQYSLLTSLIVKTIIGRTKSIVNAFWCLLLSYPFLTRWNSTDAKRVYCSGGCAALRRLRKRPPISARSGENATGEADGFLWRGCAITPALRAGQQGLGKALPNKIGRAPV